MITLEKIDKIENEIKIIISLLKQEFRRDTTREDIVASLNKLLDEREQILLSEYFTIRKHKSNLKLLK